MNENLVKLLGALRATGSAPGVGTNRPINGVRNNIPAPAPVPATIGLHHIGARQRLLQAYQKARESALAMNNSLVRR
jgi:hypothetical protein